MPDVVAVFAGDSRECGVFLPIPMRGFSRTAKYSPPRSPAGSHRAEPPALARNVAADGHMPESGALLKK